ncbi:4a-hydroxytetrahydrobiopterin dehydratase [Herbaspirillum sp. C7C8]|uniref:4a-hydroxytetrahydrobiopterin dehydratase n=1 Tax=Herbaspirillum sp. C7C8 TaxID=2736665 RepID=UPI001F51AA58|nr:4a-hydroxytetrahydrobiopterin dehydratase [Herbaspirillum sp. C7C8]MCI1003693.1 4a-hydroxytetrahydrobiopterin dehydratase [Herbaspirillum sp. C7C8]
MSITASTLAASRCIQPIEALDEAAIASHLAALPDWTIEGGKLARSFAFGNYYETLAFVNAIAWIIHADDHHPELVVTYNRCSVKFDTHSVNQGRGGLSANDFICAAKVDAIFAQRAPA